MGNMGGQRGGQTGGMIGGTGMGGQMGGMMGGRMGNQMVGMGMGSGVYGGPTRGVPGQMHREEEAALVRRRDATGRGGRLSRRRSFHTCPTGDGEGGDGGDGSGCSGGGGGCGDGGGGRGPGGSAGGSGGRGGPGVDGKDFGGAGWRERFCGLPRGAGGGNASCSHKTGGRKKLTHDVELYRNVLWQLDPLGDMIGAKAKGGGEGGGAVASAVSAVAAASTVRCRRAGHGGGGVWRQRWWTWRWGRWWRRWGCRRWGCAHGVDPPSAAAAVCCGGGDGSGRPILALDLFVSSFFCFFSPSPRVALRFPHMRGEVL